MGLFEQFMAKQAKPAEVEEETKTAELDQARLEVISEFAKQAEALIRNDGIEEYTEEDVVKVAEVLINKAIEAEENEEKIAEAYDYGKIVAQGHFDRFVELLQAAEQAE